MKKEKKEDHPLTRSKNFAAKLDRARARVRGALRNADAYTPAMAVAVDVMAYSYIALERAALEVDNLKSITVKTDKKEIIHPAYQAFCEAIRYHGHLLESLRLSNIVSATTAIKMADVQKPDVDRPGVVEETHEDQPQVLDDYEQLMAGIKEIEV